MDSIESIITIDDEHYLVCCDRSGNILEIYHWGSPLRPVDLEELTVEFLARVESEVRGNLND